MSVCQTIVHQLCAIDSIETEDGTEWLEAEDEEEEDEEEEEDTDDDESGEEGAEAT